MPVFLYSRTKQKSCKCLPFDNKKTKEIQQREVKGSIKEIENKEITCWFLKQEKSLEVKFLWLAVLARLLVLLCCVHCQMQRTHSTPSELRSLLFSLMHMYIFIGCASSSISVSQAIFAFLCSFILNSLSRI